MVSLSSANPSVATVPASVTVPANVASATFTINTSPTTGADFAVIIGQAGGVTRSANLTTVPAPTGPAIASLVIFPNTIGGTGPATGRVTLKAKATQGGQVLLTSSNPSVVQVPGVVVIDANTSVADFPVTTSRVTANTTVTITGAACCGALGSATGTITVTTAPPPPPDVVRIDQAQFKPGGRGGTLEVRARSTNATAILTVFRNASTEPTMVLVNKGGGLYEGSFSCSCAKPKTVTVRSNLGGSATANVKSPQRSPWLVRARGLPASRRFGSAGREVRHSTNVYRTLLRLKYPAPTPRCNPLTRTQYSRPCTKCSTACDWRATGSPARNQYSSAPHITATADRFFRVQHCDWTG